MYLNFLGGFHFNVLRWLVQIPFADDFIVVEDRARMDQKLVVMDLNTKERKNAHVVINNKICLVISIEHMLRYIILLVVNVHAF